MATRFPRLSPLLAAAVALAALLAGVATGAGSERKPYNPPPPRDLVWADEFAGPSGAAPSRSRWEFDSGGRWAYGTELQAYTSRRANAVLDGRGRLRIVARRERYTGRDGVTRSYTSARLTTRNRFSFTYGRSEARIRMPAGQGLLPAFWTLGTDVREVGWPSSGEIDIVEVPGFSPRAARYAAHGPTGSTQRRYDHDDDLADNFHVYGIDWSPTRIDFRFDGEITRSIEIPAGTRAFDKPHHLLFSLAVGNRWTGPPRRSTPFPATMLVDWVRVSGR
jgi:beta-glucanase (GH16 family)